MTLTFALEHHTLEVQVAKPSLVGEALVPARENLDDSPTSHYSRR